MTHRIAIGFQRGQRFPISTDSYDDLIALELDEAKKEDLVKTSWLLPSLAEWSVIPECPDLYRWVRRTIEILGTRDLQQWYPDERTEDFLYARYAAPESGTSNAPISLPQGFDELRQRILRVREHVLKPEQISAVASGLPQIALIASRHFRTPVLPFFWQSSCRATAPGNTDSNPLA